MLRFLRHARSKNGQHGASEAEISLVRDTCLVPRICSYGYGYLVSTKQVGYSLGHRLVMHGYATYKFGSQLRQCFHSQSRSFSRADCKIVRVFYWLMSIQQWTSKFPNWPAAMWKTYAATNHTPGGWKLLNHVGDLL